MPEELEAVIREALKSVTAEACQAFPESCGHHA